MNKKIIWGIIVAIVLVTGATYIYSQMNSLVTQEPMYDYSTWKTYTNEKYGVVINYPTRVNWGIGYIDGEEWYSVDNSKDDGNESLSVGFGTPSSKSGGLIWGLGVMDKNNFDQEEYIKNMGDQFGDRQEKREKIWVGSGTATLVTITSGTNKDWISKSVIVERGNKVYLMGNGAINQPMDFMQFYKSLKFVSTQLTCSNGATNYPRCNADLPDPQPSITVLSPNGGETYRLGQDLTIKWWDDNDAGNRDILITDLFHDGAEWMIQSDVFVRSSGIDGKFSKLWKISNIPAGKYKIQVCKSSTSECDFSDNFFTITN